MQQAKKDILFDPNQTFPLPYTLISNSKKSFTSLPLKQPFAYEVYCPISCKKIKIGAINDKSNIEAIQFNTTSNRWVSVFVNNDIKYLVNGHNPAKKDKRKAVGQNWSIYIDVQDKGNMAIFNPFYVDIQKPLTHYTFSTLSKAFKPSKQICFVRNIQQNEVLKNIQLNGKDFYIYQQQTASYISLNKCFKDMNGDKVTITDPKNQGYIYQDTPQQIKRLVNQHLKYWLDQLNEHYIMEQTGKFSKILQNNLDQIYEQLNYYLNIDEQLRLRLSTNKNKALINELYEYHPRGYNSLNRLISFLNYGNSRFDVFKLAELGFYNKSDMLQDLAFIQNPHIPIPSAEQNNNQTQIQLRSRTFPFSRLTRSLSYPNISLSTCLKSISAQTISNEQLLITQITDPYILFVDKQKKVSVWSGKLMPIKLFQLDLLKENSTNYLLHSIVTEQNQIKIQKTFIQDHNQQSILDLGDIFGEQQPKKEPAPKPAQIVPDQTMVQQLLLMGYSLNVTKQALINVKNQSVPAAIDQIQKILEQQKKTQKKKPKPKGPWFCPACTYENVAKSSQCQICGTEPQIIDQQELQRKIKQEQQRIKNQEQAKKELQRIKSQKQLKAKQEAEKKQKQLQQKQKKIQFLKNSEISYVKVFRCEKSSVNPFIVVVLFSDKQQKKSLLKVIRMGYNRILLTQFYRFENNSFISNYNRNIYSQKGKQIQSINQIITDAWQNIEIINRLAHAYRPDQYIVLQQKELYIDELVIQTQSNGSSIFLMTDTKKQRKFKLNFNDDIQKSTFSINEEENVKTQSIEVPKCSFKLNFLEQIKNPKQKVLKADSNKSLSLVSSPNISSIFIQVVEHIPSGKWNGCEKYTNNFSFQSKSQTQVVMSQFIPLMIQNYEGSIFSSKYHSTSLFQRNNLYISNYPQANFTFKNINSKNMLVQTVTIISTNKRLQKIYPIQSGLIFTANQISWFEFAKKRFSNFKKKQYIQWLNTKKDKNSYRQFWQPVAFFQLQSQTEVQIQFKRPAKYIFLLPTSVRCHSEKVDVAAIKIDFFGAKGRIQDQEQQRLLIHNFKQDCSDCHNILKLNGKINGESDFLIRKRVSTNLINYISSKTDAFKQTPLSISTFYEIKVKKSQKDIQITVQSEYLNQIRVIQETQQQNKVQIKQQLQVNSYKSLMQNYGILSQNQVAQCLKSLQMRQFLCLILKNTKSFRVFQKILKIIYDNKEIMQKMFQSMNSIVQQLCSQQVEVNQYGLKSFLRIYEKISTLDNAHTFKSLCTSWFNITNYVQKIRNKNYTVLRNKYDIQQLVLEPQLFSKDYYRLIYPNYIEEQQASTIVLEPKTEINNLLYIEKQNNWYYKSYLDLRQQKNVEKIQIYFPKIVQSANRFKIAIKIFAVNDESEELIYYRYFNQQMLYQFGTIAYKDKQIYSQQKVNYFSIQTNKKTRFLKFQFNYLLLTALNSLRYKQPTEPLMLYPLVKSSKVQQTTTQKSYENIINSINKIYPSQAKHSSLLESLPPVKYSIDRNYSYYEIYQFPISNPEIISKQFSSLIDKITTNIMDKQIVEECMKGMKISQYQFNKKGLDFAYIYLINLLKYFKKMPEDYKVDVQLLLFMFDIFVVYQIGPIMKKVMGFINQVYKRLSNQQKSDFISQIISNYLSKFDKYKELKQSEKYSLSKIMEKLLQLQLPIGILMTKFEQAYNSNNRFLVSMLLKILKPNIQKFGLEEKSLKCINHQKLKESANDNLEILPLRKMIDISFKFNLWVLNNVQSIKIQLLNEGLDLLLIFMNGKFTFIEKNKIQDTKLFINSIEEDDIWKLVFLTLKLKNQELNKKTHEVFQILIQNTTQKFKKSINKMLLQIIKKQAHSAYTKINGEVNDDLWMNHLQTILEYLDIQNKNQAPKMNQKASQNTESMSVNKKSFSLDIQTAIQLLNLPLTPVLWSHVLLIIPKEDRVLNSIIKNFKKQYYSSLGKQITKFCQPLAGIRSLESIHINWLDLVRKIRLQGRSIFSLFIEQLRKSSFGGRQGVSMSTLQEVKQLQITSQFLKLVLQNEFPKNQINQTVLQDIFVWFFLNYTDSKGESPASELLANISNNIWQFIKKLIQHEQLIVACIKKTLQIKKDSQKMEGMFEQKRIPTHSALSLNKRFCKCFEDLVTLFVSNDKMSSYFAFQIQGLEYIMEKLNLSSNLTKKAQSDNLKSQQNYLPVQQFLLQQKILAKNVQKNVAQLQIKGVQDLKEEQFGNNVKLVANMNQTASTTSVDWTVYKKGNKTKIIFLPMTDPSTFYEFPLYVQLGKIAEVRSIKIGFPCASFQYTDKVVVSPSSVIIEGSLDMKSFEPLGQMTYVDDDGYLCNGVKVWALNLQKIRSHNKIDQTIKQMQVHRVKYLKIVVKRPLTAFIQGAYSQLNGRPYNNLGVSISFLSVIGDDISKFPNQMVDSCKQITKRTALAVLSSLLTESNSQTMKRISNQQMFESQIKQNFHQMRDLMSKYKQIVPQIIYTIGAKNQKLGDWLIEQFIKDGKQQAEAKIINQIIVSTPTKVYQRINYFQRQLFKQLNIIRSQSQAQSSVLYTKYVPFMESFCKTLQQCYEIDFTSSQINIQKHSTLQCDQQKINSIIDIYDKKYSSPDIKSLLKLLISLIWIKKPLQLSEQVISNTLNLIWKNCSEDKPYFYNIMSALLVSKLSTSWMRKNDHSKVKSLIKEIDDSLTKQNYKALRSQIFLLSILSYHESQYLRSVDYHITIYNALKVKTFPDSQIYDYLMKIQQNIVLGQSLQEQKLAKLLIDDVSLLVKRKDPVLQKLFVGLLAVQEEVMVHLKGLDILSMSSKTKKVQGVPSKLLNKQQQKALSEKIGKKLKYHLSFQTQSLVRLSDIQSIISSLYTSSGLIIFKLKYENKIYHCGVYCPVKPVRAEQDFYYWQQEVRSDKSCFMFTYYGDNQHLYFTSQNGNKIISIYNCDQQEDHSVTFYQNNHQMIRFVPDNPTSFEIKGDILGRTDRNYFAKAQLLGMQIFECRSATSGASSQTKISELLSKSNQAKCPFTWYRHNPIYIFPSQINFKKLQKLLSAKLNFCSPIDKQKMKLKEIETDDFIIDVSVQNSDDYTGEQDFGYIPKMHIFDAFSRLGGINQVLRLGSQSIKDWKNANRKKNFQHYMEQLKSFIHLPNFFSLFIKNHTYVTFLFEVAAGMPDDTNSTRNWQQQEVNSSRFIYKILSDIFKFDRSKQLRDMNKYQDFCQIILQKLSEISKQAPRALKQEQAHQQSNLQVVDKIQKKKTQQQKRRKKKGIGYGADNQNSSKWSSTQWLQNKKARSQQILRVVSIFVSFLDCEIPIEDQRISLVIKSSCLLPLVQSALRSSSLLQIAKQIDLFKNYLLIIKNLAKNPATVGCVLDLQKTYKPEQTQSIHSLLAKLNNISQIFLECLKSGKETTDQNNQATQSLALEIQKTFLFIDKAVKNLNKNKSSLTIKQINQLPIQDAYRVLLNNLRFGYIDLKKGSTFQHALHSSISPTAPSTQKILRLSQELADLSSSLPCQHTNSIFVRCDRSRIDVVKILIMGSKDTPYSNGAFMFDLYCDDSYPNNPPKMVISTTGQGKIRFNPNLYSCGKVCLSLLGTWRGSASQNWDPKLSTLLQLFISTQGITMSEDVYFNEPGFDGEQGTQQGEKKNEAYSNIVRLGNVRYAMIDQIKNPPKGFQDVISRHFYVKRKQIIEQCEKWLQYADKRQASYTGLVSDHNSSWCGELKASKTKYKQLLEKDVQTLKQLLLNLPQPDLKQKNQEQVSFSANKPQKRKRKAHQVSTQIDVDYQNKTEQLKIQQNVMQDRWSRYIGAMGIQAVKKQASSNVLLVGLKSLGLQIAKNLVLSGLQKLTIVENDILDSGSQQHFYMSNLKGKKIQQCIFKIKQLNPYMMVDHRQSLPESFKGYNVVVSTLSMDESLKISQKCRQQQVKFVYSETSGVSSAYFADLGQSFAINDNNGEQPFQGLIEKISTDKEAVVKLLDGIKHPYQDGDYVVFTKVEGMQIENQNNLSQESQAQQFYDKMICNQLQQKNIKTKSINGKVFKIKVINWNSFSIGDTTGFTSYIRNGLVKNIKIPQIVKYQSFTNCIQEFDKYVDPNMGIYDFEKMGDNFSIFASFKALSQYIQKNKQKPENWNAKHSSQFIQLVKQIATNYKKSQQQIKSILQFAKKFSLISQSELPSISAYIGGIVSQQIIKALTNKYTPINQFFVCHLNQLMQKIPEEQADYSKLFIKKQQPFRNIKIVIGQQNMNKIQNMKLFVVGAGAIGCQLLKNFAMVNMAAKGKLTVTDPDHIQTSNLTRQFLFRQKHVKKPKSATAAAVLMQMNQNLKNHISARLDKVCQQSQDIYTDQFFKQQTIIANALDNVKARQYIDKRCVNNKVSLFESGTLGPKGHVQVIVPYKTQNYGSQNDPNEEVQIPHCTLKMFPEDVTHCIEWSRDIFGKVFTLNPKALKKVIESKDVSSIQGKEKQTIAKLIKYRPATFQDCLKESVRVFFKYFRNDIRQLLYTYPLDMKTKEGKLFWSLPKRPPTEIKNLDINDQIHLTFITSYSVLLAKIYSIDYPNDFRKLERKKALMEQALKVQVPDFVPSQQKSKQIQEMNEKQQNNKQKMSQGNEAIQPANIIKQQIQVKITQQLLKLKIIPQQFEKDQDGNGHIDLIYSMSNLRARNYQIGQCKWIDAKLKAGRIMAALSTTTSVVAALQTLQIIKLVVGSEVWRNAFVNLAVPLVQISQPGPAAKQKIGNTQFSVWQDWQFKAESLKDLLHQIRQKYQIQGFNISTSEGKPIFWQAMYKGKEDAQENLLSKNLSEIIGKQKVALNILFRDLKGQKIYEKVPKIIVQTTK